MKASGFTLIEILITLAIFTALLGLGLFMSLDAYRGTAARSEAQIVATLLERARSRAMANVLQAPWGVCFVAPNYVVFKGSECSSADSSAETTASSAGVEVSGLEVVFAQLSGTTTGASITIKQSLRTEIILVNHEGTIEM